MRIIAGTAKSRRIEAPAGRGTRPTQDYVREALFNILQSRVEGAQVLDLFAGSGALSLEALSRGARQAVLVDAARQAIGVTHRNIAALGFEDRCQVIPADALRALERLKGRQFDLVFLDPPYDLDATPFLQALSMARLIAPQGLVVLEHQKGREPPAIPGLKLESQRVYGDTGITFYALGEDERDA